MRSGREAGKLKIFWAKPVIDLRIREMKERICGNILEVKEIKESYSSYGSKRG